jgi:hypothetical protein
MKIKTNVKAGIGPDGNNHNQVITRSLTVKSRVRAGIIVVCKTDPIPHNHCQTVAGSLKVKSSVYAGSIIMEG